ncbi:MAG: tRNA (cytidine(34)-2'-O)-methyltransferase [Verrucomicrobiota bacterium]
MFNVVLVEPEIPPNTGNIGRLCLATGSTLHLIKPLGFSLSDKALRRAGLDYWREVKQQIWDSWEDFEDSLPDSARFFLFTTKTEKKYWGQDFSPQDYLIFGRETKGLPESLLQKNEKKCLTIPMENTRSLNLATAVGIVLYEAIRQNS